MFGHIRPAGLTCIFALGFISTAHAETCEATPHAIRLGIEDALQAYALWDWERMSATLSQVRHDRLCTQGVLSQGDVLRMYLLEAASYSHARDLEGAISALRGVLAVDPTYDPGEAFAAPGSLLADAYAVARGVESEPTLPLPAGLWMVDGRAGVTELPTARVVLVQRRDPSTGMTIGSLYLTGFEESEANLISELMPKAEVLPVEPPPEAVRVMRIGSLQVELRRRP